MEYILISLAWVALGAAFNYWTYKTAYKEGLLDAVAQHNRGELVYYEYIDENGEPMLEIEFTKGKR